MILPVIDPVEVAGVVQPVVPGRNRPQVFGHEHVEGGDSLQVDGVIVVVSPAKEYNLINISLTKKMG